MNDDNWEHQALKDTYRPTVHAHIGCEWTLTRASMISRVRGPPLICSTHCCHPLSWNKHWITHERYLSSFSCVLIWFNGTMHRRRGITTVDWRVK